MLPHHCKVILNDMIVESYKVTQLRIFDAYTLGLLGVSGETG